VRDLAAPPQSTGIGLAATIATGRSAQIENEPKPQSSAYWPKNRVWFLLMTPPDDVLASDWRLAADLTFRFDEA